MNRCLKLAALPLVVLMPLAACTQSPATQLSWGVNDRVAAPATRPALQRQASAQSSSAKSSTAKTYAYDDNRAAPKERPDYSMPFSSARITAQSLDAPAASPASTGRFLWPANGRVISGFGPASNGQRNDGINIAVAEGTPIRAAASGRVSYAGSGLKDYGNLLLIQHSDGYVTAYAHAQRLLVQKGDVVSRGQVIAYAGRTGDVSTSQLHFEIRRGTTPVDPDDYLTQRNS